jgi:hypothetical protein
VVEAAADSQGEAAAEASEDSGTSSDDLDSLLAGLGGSDDAPADDTSAGEEASTASADSGDTAEMDPELAALLKSLE